MKAGASPRVVPPPRRPNAKELSSLPRESSAARVASPQPPRWRDETLPTPISKPAEPPQQVSRDTAPPVRRSSTPVQATRPPPPVRAPPLNSARSNEVSMNVRSDAAPVASHPTVVPAKHAPISAAVDDIRRGRASGGEDDVPVRGTTTTGVLALSEQSQGSSTTFLDHESIRPPREGPAGPSRDLSLRQAEREAQRPTPHSTVVQTNRIHDAPQTPGDQRSLTGDGGSPRAPTLVGSITQRRPTLADSPSSPSAGKRSVLPPTRTFALCANTDVPISTHHRSHLPSERAVVQLPYHVDASQNASISGVTGGPLQPSLGSSTASIAASASRRQATVVCEPFRQPALSPPQNLPPAIQPSGCHSRDPQVYGPTPLKWECLEQSHVVPTSLVPTSGATESEAPTTAPTTHLVQEQQHPHMLGDTSTVTCIVQVVCSESHYLRDALFDPVSEVRFSRCDLSATTVRRLVELVHMSLDFRPSRRGVLRCFASENAPGLLSIPGQHNKHIALAPEGARLSAFFDATVFRFLKRSEDRVVRLRWVEDGQPPTVESVQSTATPAAVAVATPTNQSDHANPSRTGASIKATAARGNAESPVTLEGFRIEVSDRQANTTSASMVRDAPDGTFSGSNPNPMHPAAAHPIPVFCVPSRSHSAASTPNLSPVRSALLPGFVGGGGGQPTTSGRQSPADSTRTLFEVQREMLLSVAEGQQRFDGHQHAGAAASAGVRRTPAAIIPPAAATSASSSANVSRSGAASQSSSVMIDGVAYTPKSPRAQKLAQEIAALRAAIYSDEGRRVKQHDRTVEERQQHQDPSSVHYPSFDNDFDRVSF